MGRDHLDIAVDSIHKVAALLACFLRVIALEVLRKAIVIVVPLVFLPIVPLVLLVTILLVLLIDTASLFE